MEEELLINSDDLSIPIYLNQQIVFDLLAVFENGFSQIIAFKESESNNENLDCSISGKMKANILSFFKVSLNSDIKQKTAVEAQSEMSGTKVHTPASLFWKLRKNLSANNIIKKIDSMEVFDNLVCGDFVEFEATIRKNPLIESIETLLNTFELMKALEPFMDMNSQLENVGKNQQNKSGKGAKNNTINKSPFEIMKGAFEGFYKSLTSSNDIYGEILTIENGKAVIVTKDVYYNDTSIQDLIDGKFIVLGRITQKLSKDCSDSINLLRNTNLNGVNQELIEDLTNKLNTDLNQTLTIPEIFNEIKYPAIQIIPIAIYR